MPEGREMPKYRCHKTVWALKIKDVQLATSPREESDGSRLLVFEDEGYAPRPISCGFFRKHKPTAGGYFVVYEDGYESFSPATPFEAGYAKCSTTPRG